MAVSNNSVSAPPIGSQIEEAVRRWSPVQMLLEDGFPEEEVDVLTRSIVETLAEHESLIQHHDLIVAELEDFIFYVMEQHEVYLEDNVLEELSKKIISLHNQRLRRMPGV